MRHDTWMTISFFGHDDAQSLGHACWRDEMWSCCVQLCTCCICGSTVRRVYDTPNCRFWRWERFIHVQIGTAPQWPDCTDQTAHNARKDHDNPCTVSRSKSDNLSSVATLATMKTNKSSIPISKIWWVRFRKSAGSVANIFKAVLTEPKIIQHEGGQLWNASSHQVKANNKKSHQIPYPPTEYLCRINSDKKMKLHELDKSQKSVVRGLALQAWVYGVIAPRKNLLGLVRLALLARLVLTHS